MLFVVENSRKSTPRSYSSTPSTPKRGNNLTQMIDDIIGEETVDYDFKDGLHGIDDYRNDSQDPLENSGMTAQEPRTSFVTKPERI